MPPSGAHHSALASEILDRLTRTYDAARDPVKALPMAAYMRNQFAYLGITAPERVVLNRTVVDALPAPTQSDLRYVARACWDRTEREYQYFAVWFIRRYVGVCDASFVDDVRPLITTKPWWDTVDELATHVVGPLVERFPSLVATMDEWVRDTHLWLVRVAILYQARYRERTDRERLFRYCAAQAGHDDFFIRKAIGWALREYAKVDPAAVIAFVATHESDLSGLSRREALKNVRVVG
jgi:3-methyladenine DNA glycosylase AlkD